MIFDETNSDASLEPTSAQHSGGGCHMCLAIPGRIVEITSEDNSLALVEVVGVRRHVNLGLLADDRPKSGDWVLIHVGYAMSKISEQDAADQMRTLEMLGECEAAMEEVKGYGLEEEETKPVSRGSVNS
jgi:hydrogenase expression/formation protein HypC